MILLHQNLFYAVALTADIQTLTGILHAHALQVEVLNRSILIHSLNYLNTGGGTVGLDSKSNLIADSTAGDMLCAEVEKLIFVIIENFLNRYLIAVKFSPVSSIINNISALRSCGCRCVVNLLVLKNISRIAAYQNL